MRFVKVLAAVVLGLLMLIAVGGLVLVYGKGFWASPVSSEKIELTPVRIQRGEYLATRGAGCTFCHAQRDWTHFSGPPVEGAVLTGGRHANPEAGKFLWAPNLTSDPETGIAKWTDGELIRAIREGVNRHGKMIPAMYCAKIYSRFSDEDVRSIVAYLRTLPPVVSPPPALDPMPFDFFWWEYVRGFPLAVSTVAEPNRNDVQEYGTYLTRIQGCEACHEGSQPFAGGRELFDPTGPDILRPANLTPDETGLLNVSEDQFLAIFAARRLPEGRASVPRPVAGAAPFKSNSTMPWATLAAMTDEDFRTIYRFLRTVPPVKHAFEKRSCCRK